MRETIKSDNMPGREWLSIKEAAKIVGVGKDAMRRMVERGELDARKIIHRGCPWWAVRPDSVEELARRREQEQVKRDAGLEWCPKGKHWKPLEEFREYGNGHRDSYCRECRRGYLAEWAKGRRRDYGSREPVRGNLLDMVGPQKRAEPEDSLKYACMDVGFAHRPIPHGETKRQAFCARCEAARCVHHPEMTPEEVRLFVRPKVMYSAKLLASIEGVG